ncbi:hypothetical protein niasHT_011728 [Heterodera trifolii]|uniref:Integrase zinc-binding domain-containing protein n=1 Tax=Heterodera trifolii TaxID=157864 RepID=A0ABD2LGS9_9BILA
MDAEIEQFVENCQPCQNAAKAPVKANLQTWPKATHPWQRVHIDYAGPFFGKDYLIIVDGYSKYPEVFEMAPKSTAATINKLRFVDTFKRTFRKLKGGGAPGSEIIETFLVSYRTTPCDSLNEKKSPAEMFLGRKPRTTLDLLKPPTYQPNERDEKMEQQFNKRYGTRPREFSLRSRRTSDNDRPWQIFLDTFNVPKPKEIGIGTDEGEIQLEQEIAQNDEQGEEIGISDDNEEEDETDVELESPIQPPRYPQLIRRAPQRYSP